MPKKLSQNLYYLSWILIIILSILACRLIKLYDIFCTIFITIAPILFGYIFAWILKPVMDRLSKRIDYRMSYVLLIITFLSVYGVIIWKVIPIIFTNIASILDMVNSYISKLSDIEFFGGFDDIKLIDIDMVIASCSNLITFVVEFVLIHIFGFYILYNYDLVTGFLKSLIPKKYKKISLEYVGKMSSNMRLYIKGTLFDMLVLFILSSVLYSIIGLKYPVLLALFSAITNVIPFVGPLIGGIPAVLVGLSENLNLGLVTLGVIVIAQMLESNLINPMIMSKLTKLNPILIIISVTVMGKFFGFVGMIFAVPALIVVKLTIDFVKKYRHIKN